MNLHPSIPPLACLLFVAITVVGMGGVLNREGRSKLNLAWTFPVLCWTCIGLYTGWIWVKPIHGIYLEAALLLVMAIPFLAFLVGAAIMTAPGIDFQNGRIEINKKTWLGKFITSVLDVESYTSLCAMSWMAAAFIVLAPVVASIVFAVAAAFGLALAILALLILGQNPVPVFTDIVTFKHFPHLRFGSFQIKGRKYPTSPLVWALIVATGFVLGYSAAFAAHTGQASVWLSALGAWALKIFIWGVSIAATLFVLWWLTSIAEAASDKAIDKLLEPTTTPIGKDRVLHNPPKVKVTYEAKNNAKNLREKSSSLALLYALFSAFNYQYCPKIGVVSKEKES